MEYTFLEGGLDQVSFADKLELPKILVLGLPQNTSNVNNGYEEDKDNCILYVIGLLEPWYLYIYWLCFVGTL